MQRPPLRPQPKERASHVGIRHGLLELELALAASLDPELVIFGRAVRTAAEITLAARLTKG